MKDMEANDIPPIKPMSADDRFENAVREYGVIKACVWFNSQNRFEFALEVAATLRRRWEERS